MGRRYRAGTRYVRLLKQRFEEIMGSVPIIFGTFKLLVLFTGMFFAIKSHFDGEKKEKAKERQEQEKRALGKDPGNIL